MSGVRRETFSMHLSRKASLLFEEPVPSSSRPRRPAWEMARSAFRCSRACRVSSMGRDMGMPASAMVTTVQMREE
jgi:hypothetical protein